MVATVTQSLKKDGRKSGEHHASDFSRVHTKQITWERQNPLRAYFLQLPLKAKIFQKPV